jgi:hypothetical protein
VTALLDIFVTPNVLPVRPLPLRPAGGTDWTPLTIGAMRGDPLPTRAITDRLDEKADESS